MLILVESFYLNLIYGALLRDHDRNDIILEGRSLSLQMWQLYESNRNEL